MKKFTKLFLSCMAVSAITAAVATSAMAADLVGNVKGSYDESGKLTITNIDELGIKPETQVTILVVGPNVAETATITEANIEYINQDGAENVATAWATVGLKNAPKEANEAQKGEYTVKIGYTPTEGEFKIAKSTFKIGGSDRLIGDVDGNTQIQGSDAASAASHAARATKLTGEDLQAADADDNGQVQGPDAAEIAKYAARQNSIIDGVKTISDKQHTVAEN